MLSMAATPSLKILATVDYKGGTKTISNRYHFNGGTPADATHWHTLMDNVTAAQKLIHDNHVVITEAIGYNAGSDLPVATKTYSLAGTATVTDGILCPTEVAGLIRWSTTALTSKNHPVYLFSYIRWAWRSSGSTDTTVISAQWQTLLNTYAGAWQSGFSDGTNTYTRAGPNGASAVGHTVPGFLTHRDFRD